MSQGMGLLGPGLRSAHFGIRRALMLLRPLLHQTSGLSCLAGQNDAVICIAGPFMTELQPPALHGFF